MLIYSFVHLDIRVEVFDSLDERETELWEGFSTSYLNTGYLKFLQDSEPSDLTFRYVFLKTREGKICGLAYLQKLKFSAKNIGIENRRILSSLFTIALKLKTFSILICGNLFAVNFPALITEEELIQNSDVLSILNELEKRENSTVFILKDLAVSFTQEEMEQAHWKSYSTDLTMELSIRPGWKSGDDYLKDLTKKYRRRAEKIISAGREMKRVELTALEIKKNQNKINDLFKHVSSRQNIRLGLISDSYFYQYKIFAGDLFKFLGYFLGEELIAFATYVYHDSFLEVHYIGIDYNHNDKLKIYFNILFDSVIRAISDQKKTLELGRTARQAKANLGAEPVIFNDYFRVRGYIANQLVKFFAKSFQEKMGDGWETKNPLKKPETELNK